MMRAKTSAPVPGGKLGHRVPDVQYTTHKKSSHCDIRAPGQRMQEPTPRWKDCRAPHCMNIGGQCGRQAGQLAAHVPRAIDGFALLLVDAAAKGWGLILCAWPKARHKEACRAHDPQRLSGDQPHMRLLESVALLDMRPSDARVDGRKRALPTHFAAMLRALACHPWRAAWADAHRVRQPHRRRCCDTQASRPGQMPSARPADLVPDARIPASIRRLFSSKICGVASS